MEIEPLYFTYNDETITIIPGKNLPKNELIKRLREMDIVVESSNSKNNLIKSYEYALRKDENKIKIFDKLKKDNVLFKKIHNSQRINLEENNQYIINNRLNKHKYDNTSFETLNREEDVNMESTNSSFSSESSSSFSTRLINFLNNNKKDIFMNLVYLLIYFYFDRRMKRFSKNNYFSGKIINYFTRIVTKKRIILGFFFYYGIKCFLEVYFYYLFGFGFFTIMYLIYKNKIKDFLLN